MTKKQNPVNKKARAGGMPACAPTATEREIVEKAAGFGLPHDKICQLIVSERTGKPIDAKCARRFAPSLTSASWMRTAPSSTRSRTTLFTATTSQRSTASRRRR
jgi:hypothetical protein